ncbi:DUF1064 domain-containing protein [Paenibacillus jilunlii]|uniref:DUF1064 domain-containing protein n=1 Tax=Paenibacillus jilunlii TaxID=682956 RepID=A0A1H0A0G0_9BACL|nr:DUF1064 domain-containing protein [Paenibacillus jilunlii]KWX79933.1 hypothetical protein AML91_01830 [Paenibacillus jilunlii]SDN26925.1 Protein of unknown function [Paenibacillus jilunlii]
MANKYGARKTQVNGIWFASGAEAHRYQELMLLKRAGVVTDIVLQPVYTLMEGRVNKATGKKVASIKYKADFLVTYADGHQEIEDVKGFKTAVYQLKKRMFMIQYPDLYIKEVSA